MSQEQQPIEIAQTRDFAVSELIEPDYNPNVMDAAERAGLAESIDEFGLVEYPVVNIHDGRHGVIVGGSHRVQRAREVNQQSLPCIVVDLPLDKEKELNLRLNKHRGRPQGDILREYFEPDQLTVVGYTPADLDRWEMLSAAGAQDLAAAGVDHSAVPSPGAPPVMPSAPGPPVQGGNGNVTAPLPPATPAPEGSSPVVFTPETQPTIATGEVTDADVDKAKNKLDNKFAGAKKITVYDCVCPHCGGEFQFNV